jgi:hypothetical protein
MQRKKLIGIVLIIAILLASSFFIGTLYSGRRVDYFGTKQASMEKLGQTAPTPAPESEIPKERMVIYNAYISIETNDIQGTLSKIRSLAEGLGGYVAGSSISSYGAQTTATISIRVPQTNFHKAVQVIESYGKVLDERTSSEDITEEYIDLKARLGNLERQEKRLYEILGMAKTVDEVLQVERELERIRGQIESLQGRINYLERSVAMSLIEVQLTEPLPPFTPPGMDWGETFEAALAGFFAVLRGLIVLTVSLTPLIIIAIPVYVVYRRRKRAKIKALVEGGGAE